MHLKRLIVNRTEYEDLKDIKKLKAKLFLTSLLTLYMGGTIDRNQLQW